MNLFIFGAGFSGRAIAREWPGPVAGTTRSGDRFAALESDGIEPFVFDGTVTDALAARLGEATHLVQSIAPARSAAARSSASREPGAPDAITDPVLRAMAPRTLPELAPKLEWVGYLSTVGVYGNHDGAWVDEETPPAPASERSRQRVLAEAEWLTLSEATGLPVAVLRLSGIYGPGRNAFVNAEEGRARRLVKPGQVFNRIHVADIAAAARLAGEQRARGVFNVTDDEPAPPQDVVLFAHELAGREPPPEIAFDTADLSPMARSFYGENKRVSNAKSKRVLGLEYSRANYRAALERMWREDGWR